MSDRGTLEALPDGLWRLVFVRRLAHPPERVWRALTEPEGLATWFPAAIEGERVVGAKWRFVFPDDPEPALEGELTAWQPPELLEFRWDTDWLRFELRPLAGGGTELTFFSVFPEHGTAARDATGWDVCLELLEAWLDDRPGPDDATAWKPLFDEYTGLFGPEAAAIGPPPGHDLG